MLPHADPQVLIERSYPLVYHLALSILDDPVEAGAITRAAGLVFIDAVLVDPRQVTDPAWLYQRVIQLCRARLRFKRYLQYLPDHLRTLLGLPAVRQPVDVPPPESGSPIAWTVCQMDEEFRLPLILRYAHDLPPYAIAQVLDWKDDRVLAHLSDARQRLRPFWGTSSFESEAEDSFNHEQAQVWVEAAANQAITDSDAKSLARHLKNCARCQEYAARLAAQENDLRAAFRARWGSADIPTPPAFVEEVNAAYRRRRSLRHTLSLAGATLFTLSLMILVLFLSERIVPDTRPPAISVSPTTVPIPTVPPTLMVPVSKGDLLSDIYPGKIVYVAFNDLSNHLFTIQPVSKEVRKLTLGFTENSFPAWSPDGSEVAYLSIPEGWGLNQIMVIHADGGGRHLISRPDFRRYSPQSSGSQDLAVTHYPLYGPPHWSPDGKLLVSVVWVSPEETSLGVFSLSDAPARYLAVDRLDRTLLDWSPDGRSIAYVTQANSQVWIWEPDQPLVENVNPRRIGEIANWDWLYGLDWSPDSERLAIWGGHDYGGRIETALTLFARSGKLDQWNPIASGVRIRTPVQMAWSPDGRYLALLSAFEENGTVWGGQVLLASADGRNLHALIEVLNPIDSLAWSPDSRWLAYSSSGELWAASLVAYEQSQDYLLLLKPSAGTSLSWQPILQP
jgi:Tol biopolymer transport system component